jgi:hypothetical protein
MNRQLWWMTSGLAAMMAVAVGGLTWWHANNAPAPNDLTRGNAEANPPWLSQVLPGANNTATRIASSLGASGGEPASPYNPLDHIVPPTFKANKDGTLALLPQTRVDVERLHALYSRDEAMAKLAAFSEGLPEQAKRDLKDLFQRYAQYAQAAAQTYPPGLTLNTVDDAERQLAGLHDLRQQYFGTDKAEALFGDEEKTSHELMALMHQQSTPGMSLEDKATQAQGTWKKAHPSQP